MNSNGNIPAIPLLPPFLASSGRAILAEGPSYVDGVLTWVDIVRSRLLSYSLGTGELRSYPTLVGEAVGFAVATTQRDTYLCGGDRGMWLLRLEGENPAALPIPGSEALTIYPLRFNDAKVDPFGRLVAGTMDIEEQQPLGNVILLHPDFHWDTLEALGNVTISNGLDWSPDGSALYYIDSPTKVIVACDYQLDPPFASRRRTVLDFARFSDVLPKDAFPDGMAADNIGRLWVAIWGGASVLCIDPATSAIVTKVSLPTSRVTSCSFGSDGMIFITTAVGNLPDSVATDGEADTAGKVYLAAVGCGGRPSVPFALTGR